jgi:hypothetical protein
LCKLWRMNPKWLKRFELMRAFLWMALPGALLLVVTAFTPQDYRVWPGVFAVLLIAPALIYIYVLILWHWKDRYRGKHSDLWGALLLLETTGWFKLVYLFRHLLPDMRNSGRYRARNPIAEVS